MTAKELIAAGYRLHWLKIEKEIPVLRKPGEDVCYLDAEEWAKEDDTDWEVTTREMAWVDAETRKARPFCADIDREAPPTIGELLDAQKEAT